MPTPKFIEDIRRKVGHQLLLLPTVVVIARDRANRLLLVLDKDAGLWTLPGGIVEPNETPAAAAVREVFEETGLRARLDRIVGVFGGPGCETTYANGDRIAWVATAFSASLGSDAPSADGVEVSEAGLFSSRQVAGLAVRADSRMFLAANGRRRSGAYFQA